MASAVASLLPRMLSLSLNSSVAHPKKIRWPTKMPTYTANAQGLVASKNCKTKLFRAVYVLGDPKPKISKHCQWIGTHSTHQNNIAVKAESKLSLPAPKRISCSFIHAFLLSGECCDEEAVDAGMKIVIAFILWQIKFISLSEAFWISKQREKESRKHAQNRGACQGNWAMHFCAWCLLGKANDRVSLSRQKWGRGRRRGFYWVDPTASVDVDGECP